MDFSPTKGKLMVTLITFFVLLLMGNWLLGCHGAEEVCEFEEGCDNTTGSCEEVCSTKGCDRMGFWHVFSLCVFLYAMISFFQD